MVKIPKEITLINQKIKIELDKDFVNRDNTLGFADYKNQKIILDDSKQWAAFKDETYYHELTHWVLYVMGNDLHNDEKFVSLFSSLLHQSVLSSKF